MLCWEALRCFSAHLRNVSVAVNITRRRQRDEAGRTLSVLRSLTHTGELPLPRVNLILLCLGVALQELSILLSAGDLARRVRDLRLDGYQVRFLRAVGM
jgi:hypothetical protein